LVWVSDSHLQQVNGELALNLLAVSMLIQWFLWCFALEMRIKMAVATFFAFSWAIYIMYEQFFIL